MPRKKKNQGFAVKTVKYTENSRKPAPPNTPPQKPVAPPPQPKK
ncbi:hypothetical protein [Acetobacterium malicum]|nr:hypothetical protein [Acetobacterium dehalogenans]